MRKLLQSLSSWFSHMDQYKPILFQFWKYWFSDRTSTEAFIINYIKRKSPHILYSVFNIYSIPKPPANLIFRNGWKSQARYRHCTFFLALGGIPPNCHKSLVTGQTQGCTFGRKAIKRRHNAWQFQGRAAVPLYFWAVNIKAYKLPGPHSHSDYTQQHYIQLYCIYYVKSHSVLCCTVRLRIIMELNFRNLNLQLYN